MSEVLNTALKALDDKLGNKILVYNFENINPFLSYVVIVSASNQRLVWALADHVVDCAKAMGHTVRTIEGNQESRWVLVDLADVVVHVFLEEEREHYGLEKLYADIPHWVVE